MLSYLSIRNIVLIERLDLRFEAGLSVLTGETGAGKSILLDSLALALGGRGDGGLVRHGADQGQVTAVFDLPAGHRARQLLLDNDIDPDGDLILRRVQSADGRTRAFVNDQPGSVGLLKAIGEALVEIHGQHDDRALVDAEAHRSLLDAFAGHDTLLASVRSGFTMWKAAQSALRAQRKRVEQAAREADYYRDSVAELTKLHPEPGEEEALALKRADMMRSEKIASEIAEADDIMSGDRSPVPEVAGVLRRLERKHEQAPGLLDAALAALDTALNALSDAQSEIAAALRATEYDPAELERTEERLFALRAAARKYDVAADDLADLAVRMADAVADIDAGAETLARLESEERAALGDYDRLAARLSGERQSAARELEAAVQRELPALKLERAAFLVGMTSDTERRGPDGIDAIEFRVRTNPGTPDGPMMKIASGGELSRFLLALKVALADRGSAPTLVFDEIDTGVGGAVADAIGERLKRLSAKVQVLSVTHAPQVAAKAGAHFLIAKREAAEGRVATDVTEMDLPMRSEEIARMLSGAAITDEARRAAEQLLRAG
jgi:DNA repair protein RecN (Recombination protein N)